MIRDEIKKLHRQRRGFINIVLPYELGIGQECVYQSFDIMSKVDNFDDPAEVFELLLIMANGVEHTQKGMIEYHGTLKPVFKTKEESKTGKERYEAVINTARNHCLKKFHLQLKNQIGIERATSEEIKFLGFLESFQDPNHRFENSQTLVNHNKLNLEQKIKNFVASVNGIRSNQLHLVTNQLIFDTLARNLNTLLLKYYTHGVESLEHHDLDNTGSAQMIETIKTGQDFVIPRQRPFTAITTNRNFDLKYDIAIGKKLIESGLVMMSKATDLNEPTRLWISALLMANGLEKTVKAVVLSQHERDSHEYLAQVGLFRNDTMHNFMLAYHQVTLMSKTFPEDNMCRLMRLMSDFLDGDNRYENLQVHRNQYDYETRLEQLVFNHLLKIPEKIQTSDVTTKLELVDTIDGYVMGHPEIGAYYIQQIIKDILEYFEQVKNNQHLSASIAIDGPIAKPTTFIELMDLISKIKDVQALQNVRERRLL